MDRPDSRRDASPVHGDTSLTASTFVGAFSSAAPVSGDSLRCQPCRQFPELSAIAQAVACTSDSLTLTTSISSFPSSLAAINRPLPERQFGPDSGPRSGSADRTFRGWRVSQRCFWRHAFAHLPGPNSANRPGRRGVARARLSMLLTREKMCAPGTAVYNA